ncbi:hypothetical protein STEG23_004134 [Scotinomys teguina]
MSEGQNGISFYLEKAYLWHLILPGEGLPMASRSTWRRPTYGISFYLEKAYLWHLVLPGEGLPMASRSTWRRPTYGISFYWRRPTYGISFYLEKAYLWLAMIPTYTEKSSFCCFWDLAYDITMRKLIGHPLSRL